MKIWQGKETNNQTKSIQNQQKIEILINYILSEIKSLLIKKFNKYKNFREKLSDLLEKIKNIQQKGYKENEIMQISQ